MDVTVQAAGAGPTRSSVSLSGLGWVPTPVLRVALAEAVGARRAHAAVLDLDNDGTCQIPMRTVQAAKRAVDVLDAWSLPARVEIS